MEEFDVSPLESFIPAVALERMLRLLLSLFDVINDHRREMLLSASQDAVTYHLDETYLAALQIARDDTRDLIRLLQTVDFSITEKEHLRLNGPMLRFKMMAIKMAIQEANGAHPIHGHATQRGWALYRRAILTAMKLMQCPLMTLTQVVDGPRGTIEFKQALETLMEYKSGAAA